MMEREYEKNKRKLIHNMNELNIPTEQEVEEYINSKAGIKSEELTEQFIFPDETIKDYYNVK